MLDVAAVCMLLLVLALLAGLLILPIIALVRTNRIKELVDRVERLEREVHRLRSAAAHPAPVEPAPLPVTAVAEEPILEARPVSREELPTARPEPPSPGFPDLEALIGLRGLGWIAVVLLLFAAGFFLQQLFEHDLIGELGRVCLGLAAGVGLCAGGLICHRRGRTIFAQMLTAGGAALLYLTVFASFGYYRLLPREHAAYFLIALVIEIAVLAILYEALAVALMAIVGGLLAPILLHTDRDQYQALFLYLGMLNGGVVLLNLLRPRWPAIASVALLGTQALFWGWYAESYHPDKLTAALTFQAVLFGLHMGQTVLARLRETTVTGWEELCRVAANGFLFALAGYVMLEPRYEHWLGTLALAVALAYAALAWLVQKTRPEDTRLLLVLVATAMAFVAAVFPLEMDAAWAPVGWAVQGLALWWFGLRVGALELRGIALAAFALAIVRVLAISPIAHEQPFVPVLNRYFLPALVVVVALLASSWLAQRVGAALPELTLTVALAGVGLLWVVLTVEARSSFTTRADRAFAEAAALFPRSGEPEERRRLREELNERGEHLTRSGFAAVSFVWAAYAAALLAAGFRLPSRPLRWVALGLFGLTLGKVVMVDTAHLPGLYRAAVFLILSLMMAAGAWGYQKVARRVLASEAGGASREVV
ncbi:MAG: DUF2339 domain-containing protein [Gemmataceae bacterium]|nr:DUF2339 domain-containing protein [Gemmataceae bacterium]